MKVSKFYLASLLLLMLILPVMSILLDMYCHQQTLGLLGLVGKWFTFWAIGLRLFTAGLRQVMKPGFTAKDIFHIDNDDALPVVKELGFANVCFGLTGIISLFLPQWRMAAAFAGGLYMGIAGVNHIIKKPESANEALAMISDIFILMVMAVYLASVYWI